MNMLVLAAFNMSGQEMAVWAVIGLLAGSLAGMVVKRQKSGFGGIFGNLVFGLVGAFVGGALFKALDFHTGLPTLHIDLDQVASAFAGALLVVGVVTFLSSRQKDK